MIVSTIELIVFMVLSRRVKSLNDLKVLKRLAFKPLKHGKVPVEDFLFDAFIHLGGGLIALKTASIHLSDLGQKVESGFSLYNNIPPNSPPLCAPPLNTPLSPGTDRALQAVSEQADQDRP